MMGKARRAETQSESIRYLEAGDAFCRGLQKGIEGAERFGAEGQTGTKGDGTADQAGAGARPDSHRAGGGYAPKIRQSAKKLLSDIFSAIRYTPGIQHTPGIPKATKTPENLESPAHSPCPSCGNDESAHLFRVISRVKTDMYAVGCANCGYRGANAYTPGDAWDAWDGRSGT